MSRTSKESVVLSWGRLSCSRFSLKVICCCFVCIEWWISGSVSLVLLLLWSRWNDESICCGKEWKRHGMSRTSKEPVVLSLGRLSCSSLVSRICCCFVWIERWYCKFWCCCSCDDDESIWWWVVTYLEDIGHCRQLRELDVDEFTIAGNLLICLLYGSFVRKSEWVNFTSSEWYDLLWKNKQKARNNKTKVRVSRTSISNASVSAHKSTFARFGLPPICVFREGCCFVCVVEWWVHGEFCAISWKVDYGSSKGRYVRRSPNSGYP